ncbi:MAG: anthranilate phosphoribosyltransferase [Acidobacteria bacterium 13_1_20CM_2_55_15]|nr:MAG: anthranilate phosphoribosyltransferase [Acidobacteria bacterium 13_1_40CM_56_16]OLD18673.1 MAG: anthranilate phosphoribosyltransferase [Acidobacteria bacterium 13_1_40CM_3_56_11]OLD70629.1 MAG: anthranilate phosphoribosyltransferase [Acidobacteria bacterium 13_1_40CM_2_56_11]OLE88708.1 MAG: anthranilate phosphoribosyltransferase [Acidobacteria bacterium 13_1_20CM_2_55_15]PYR69291.1 MAG: anthranilate phosphoribosyltransferase [Acidobacteriota bacterium]
MITDFIQKMIERVDLTEAEARQAMEEIMSGQSTDAQIAGFLTALRMKGETSQELVGFAGVMRERAEPLWDGEVLPVLDTAGTGGDRLGTFNISTAAAFVAAAAGVRVAKHGNRSATSRCGSADVMEALGLDIQMPVERLRRAIKSTRIGFLFAQRFHTSMKHVMAARMQLKVRTVFNILGPLANPAGARFQVVGVSAPEIMELMANALNGLNTDHAFVVHGANGMDEVSISSRTHVVEMRRGEMRQFVISPEDFGMTSARIETILGGDAIENARIIESVFGGEPGPRRDVVLLNSAPAIVAGGAAKTWKEGLQLAAEAIDSGAALRKLKELREFN